MVKLNTEFPEEFFEGEERWGHYVTPEVKKVWAVELDLLNEFARVCKKYNLQWWADGGTLLGAVRHKGYIPWDDDIDIVMMWSDYKRLCEIAPNEFKHPYFFQTTTNDIPYVRPFAKLRNSETTTIEIEEVGEAYPYNRGIWIDIFPLLSAPEDKEEQEKLKRESLRRYKKSLLFMQLRYSRKIRVHNVNIWKIHLRDLNWVFKNRISFISRIFKKKLDHLVAYRKFREVSLQYSNDVESTYLMVEYKFSLRSWYKNTIYMPFENLEIPVPEGHENILQKYYKDWRTPVKGTSLHNGTFFDTDKPYTEYVKKWM